MPKLTLSDEPESVWGQVSIGDDPPPLGPLDQHPRATIWERSIVGVDGRGDRVYKWAVFATDVHVAMLEERSEIDDGKELMRVKVTALWPGENIETTSALALSFGAEENPENVSLFRVTKLYQNQVRLEIEAERVL